LIRPAESLKEAVGTVPQSEEDEEEPLVELPASAVDLPQAAAVRASTVAAQRAPVTRAMRCGAAVAGLAVMVGLSFESVRPSVPWRCGTTA
jgi:hypothetical protein